MITIQNLNYMMCVFIGVLKRYLNQTVVKFELGAVSSSLLCVGVESSVETNCKTNT